MIRWRSAVSALVALSTGGCDDGRWIAFVYRDKTDLSKFEIIGEFESLDVCRFAARERLKQTVGLANGDYECGLECRVESDWPGILVCEETMD